MRTRREGPPALTPGFQGRITFRWIMSEASAGASNARLMTPWPRQSRQVRKRLLTHSSHPTTGRNCGHGGSGEAFGKEALGAEPEGEREGHEDGEKGGGGNTKSARMQSAPSCSSRRIRSKASFLKKFFLSVLFLKAFLA